MDCNREEAIRAKELAEAKMKDEDFVGARRLALKARQLDPKVENIEQMLKVCDVHCAAEQTVLETEKNWYNILQVEHTADEPSIKRKYRQVCLLLHPDKNKFAGAEAAFKLIGEAQTVLTDKKQRSIYDSMFKAYMSTTKTPGQCEQQRNSPQPPQTFWTSCRFCNTRYQLNRDALNKARKCESCGKHFIAIVPQDVPPRANWYQYAFDPEKNEVPKQTNYPTKQSAKIGGTSEGGRRSTTRVEEDGNVSSENRKEDNEGPKFKAERYQNVYVRARRSSCKQQVSYNEERSSEEDHVHCSKRSKRSKSSAVAEDESENASCLHEESLPTGHGHPKEGNMEKNEVDRKVEFSASDKTRPDPKFYEVPDPDFYDFDKDRKDNSFEVDQMWAIYDDKDGMPRFYARIRKVFSSGFKVRITWLEKDPDDEVEVDWFNEDLPISCGNFKQGKTENTADIGMFSHLVNIDKGTRKNTYKVYPRKGEIWALFKNWDSKWCSDADKHRQYEFEFVEVQSDYEEGSVICVCYLVKVRGFVSLYRLKAESGPVRIPSNEFLRFSHRVPSYRTTGKERRIGPKGYFELDPASATHNM